MKNKAIKLNLQIKQNESSVKVLCFAPTRDLVLTSLLVTNRQMWSGFPEDLDQLTCFANVVKQVPAKLFTHMDAKSRCGN